MFTADTEADANDPMLFLDLEYPLMNKVNIIVIGIYSLVAMCCSFLICYTVFYFWVRLFPKLKQFVISVFLRKETLINLSILVIATFVSITIGYIFFVYMKQPSETIIYQGYTNDYALSFYNTKGQKISKLNGPLKLKLDPFTIYANYPNQNSASYSIDSYGFRDTYKDNTDGQIAIVLGGSAAFGQGLSGNNDTFASNLNRLNQKYSIMNAGTVGFLSGQELSQMIHVLDRFSPSLYIVFDGWNDIFDPYSYAHRWPINGGPIGFNNTFFMIENQLATVVQKEQCSKNETSKILPCARKIFKNERKYFKAIISTYISNIDKMNAFANTRKARFLIVFQPELGNKTILSTDEQQILKDWNKSHKYLDRKIPYKYKRLIHNAKKYCKRHNIEYIDINEDPRFSKNPNTLFYDAVHPNEKGHKIIAEIINDLLVVKF
jgi:lysophospholipase L1-like esterase